jgi:hypothetical protein
MFSNSLGAWGLSSRGKVGSNAKLLFYDLYKIKEGLKLLFPYTSLAVDCSLVNSTSYRSARSNS